MVVGIIYREFLGNGERLNGLNYLIIKCVSVVCWLNLFLVKFKKFNNIINKINK